MTAEYLKSVSVRKKETANRNFISAKRKNGQSAPYVVVGQRSFFYSDDDIREWRWSERVEILRSNKRRLSLPLSTSAFCPSRLVIFSGADPIEVLGYSRTYFSGREFFIVLRDSNGRLCPPVFVDRTIIEIHNERRKGLFLLTGETVRIKTFWEEIGKV